MPTIPLPEPILIGLPPAENEEDKRGKFGLPQLLGWLVDRDYRFNSDGPGIRTGSRVDMACRSANGALDLDDDALKLVAECLEQPQMRRINPMTGAAETVPLEYPIQPARALLPFLEAVAGAVSSAS